MNNVRAVTLEHAYYVSNQPHNLLSVSQLTKQQVKRGRCSDFSNCTWIDNVRMGFQFSYDNRGLIWITLPLSLTCVDMMDGVVTDCVMAVTRSSANLQQPRSLQPTGHPKRGQHVPAATPQDHVQCEMSPAVAGFHAKHVVPIGGI